MKCKNIYILSLLSLFFVVNMSYAEVSVSHKVPMPVPPQAQAQPQAQASPHSDNGCTKCSNKLKNGLATSAALTGLFQPYNVGKVNVTAAVGGYKSKTALAVGAGYRINDHVAVKSGVAFSSQKSNNFSYNAGVNYEF